MARIARTGVQVRQTFVSQLAPVNLVVHSASGGIQVTARIGGKQSSDDPDIERAIADTVNTDGKLLGEVRLNGQTRRSA